MSRTAREKMVLSTTLLLREHGLSGTSVRDVVEHSGAPRGSVYHHFPDGKVQMVEEAVSAAGDAISYLINQLAEDGADPVDAIHTFVAAMRHVLVSTDFRGGCPVVAVAAESAEDPGEQARLARVTSRVFTDWTTALADVVEARGIAPERAKSLATLLIASIEGAVVMSRAQQSTAPLDDVERELEALAEVLI